MSILFLLDYYHPHLGGAENVFENIISRLANKGYTIHILTSKHDPKLPSTEKLTNQITITRVGTNRLDFLRYGYHTGKKLIKTKKFNLIYTTTYSSAFPARLLRWQFKIPAIITVHEIFGSLRYRYKSGLKARVSHFFEKWILKQGFDAYHCVSRYTYNALRVTYGIPDDKLHMIHNGVDHDFRDIKNIDTTIVSQYKKIYGLHGSFTLMYLGHSGQSKGLDYLLDAIPSIIKQYPDTKIILNILSSSRDNEIQQKITKLKNIVSGNITAKSEQQKHLKRDIDTQSSSLSDTSIPNSPIITFTGTLLKKDLIHRVACADCIIVPSLSEGFGLVAAEVSSLGKPLVVSGVAALPEVVSGKIVWLQPGSSNDIVQSIHKIRDNKRNILPPKYFDRNEQVKKIEILIQQTTNSMKK